MTHSKDNPSVSNPRDLTAKVLSHPQGGIGALLQLADKQETYWLEFKAALYPQDGKFDKGEKHDDYQWHVAKAAIALANAAGGAIILGLDDDLEPIGLSPSDPKDILNSKGREAFNRDVVLSALTRGKWKTGRLATIHLDGKLEPLLEVRNADYLGYPLAVILITPMPDGELLEVSQQINNHQKIYFAPVRLPGDIGKVRDLETLKESRNYLQTRTNFLQSDEYEHLWQRFLESLKNQATVSKEKTHSMENYRSILAHDPPRFRFPPKDSESVLMATAQWLAIHGKTKNNFDSLLKNLSISLPGKPMESIRLALLCFSEAEVFIKEPPLVTISKQTLCLRQELDRSELILHQLTLSVQEKLIKSIGEFHSDILQEILSYT